LENNGIARVGTYSLFVLASTFALMEIALRLAPQAIPTFALVRFHPDVRGEIARRLHLPTLDKTNVLERDDGGPRLRVFKPFVEFDVGFEEREATERFAVDEIGFCNMRGTYDDHETIDVLAIGDSFTWCTAVSAEQAWPARVRDSLGVTTYNLGRSGMGIYEYLQILRAFGLSKRPKVVILNVYEGNDLRDAIDYHEYRDRHAGESEESGSDDGRSLWRGNSYALNLVLALYKEARSRAEDRETTINFRYRLKQGDVDIPFNVVNSDTNEVEHARRIAADRRILEYFDEGIERFAEMAQEYGFVPLVTYSPSAHTTYASRVEFEDPLVGDVVARMSDSQRSHFRDLCAQHGIAYLDLTEALRSAVDPLREDTLLHFPFNLHYSPRGHAVVQDAIVGFIRAKPEWVALLAPAD
jgi:hypothetical protein